MVQEPYSAAARALRHDWVRRRVQRIAPALFASETVTALLRAAGRGAISAAAVPRSLSVLLRAVTVTADDELLASRALSIAQQLGLTKARDALYCALAEREGCEYWTGDRRFVVTAQQTFPFVHWVGEVTAPGRSR